MRNCLIYICFVTLLALLNTTLSYANDVNELLAKLNSTKGMPKIELLNSISEEYFNGDMSKSLYFAKLAIEESSKFDNDYLKLVSYFNYANASYYLGNFVESNIGIKECLLLTQKLKDYEFEIEILNLKAMLLKTTNNYNDAYLTYNQALNLAYNLKSNESIAKLLNNIGNIFESIGDYETAVQYYLNAIKSIKANNSRNSIDTAALITRYLNIGNIYLILENNKQALEFFNIALSSCSNEMKNEKGIIYNSLGNIFKSNNKLDSALINYKTALEYKNYLRNQRQVAVLLINIGEIYRIKNDFNLALKFYKDAEQVNYKFQYNLGIASINLNYAKLFIQKSDLSQAKSYLELASKLIDKHNFKTLKLELFEKYAEYFLKKGDLKKTLEYKDKYIKLKDTISFVDRNRKLNSLVAKFTMEGKDRQIEGYEAEKRIMDLENSQKKILIGMLVLVILFVIGVLLFVYHRMNLVKKHDEEVVLKNKDLEKSYAREKEVSELNRSILRIISHDFKAPLTAISTTVMAIGEHVARGNFDRISKNTLVIERSVQSLTRVINQFREISSSDKVVLNQKPVLVNYNGLIKDIISYDFLLNTDLNHDFVLNFPDYPVSGYINSVVADHIFHNLISNAVKYSPNNTNITIDLKVENGIIYCSIKDVGIGIPVAEQDKLFSKFHRFSNTKDYKGTGIGLYLVKRALTELKGSIEIISAENAGTTVNFSFPLDTRTAEDLAEENNKEKVD